MFDLGVMAGAYALFHATHGIADYWVQTDWQAQNKTKNPVALWRHIATYTACFIPAVLLLALYVKFGLLWGLLLLLAIGLPHAWMDTRKFLTWFIAKTKGWKPGDIDKAIQENETGSSGTLVGPIELEQYMYKAAARVHVNIHMDQKFHYLSLLLVSIMAAWN